ncbi:MAG: carbohydrate binding family 9 domain-containing protein [Blastocatellia bacterium]|nr:carbohydrate binding family 9 domain-containing protein [Blastocatellia bacterium]
MRFLPRFLAFCLICLTGSAASLGQSLSAPADTPLPSGKFVKTSTRTIAVPPEKVAPVRVPFFETPPTIDGEMAEPVWTNAVELRDFYQTNPGDNIEPSRKTVVRVGYDAKNLYFGFICFDEPDRIRATFAQRDTVFSEDNIRVFLDTFNDQRRAYVLGFNPYGIQQDGILTNGAGTDYSVDVVMVSKGKITAEGWLVEAAIPFKSLRYEAGKGKQWGFHVWRNIDRFNDEIDSWEPISRDITGLLNQAGHLTGLDRIATEHNLEIIPTLTVSETGKRIPPGRFLNKPVRGEVGLTAKYGITPNITLDLAINPDFADVEADQPVLLANQRFPIFFPERRPFFLENIDIFQTSLQPVNTRAIVDPDIAVKLSGKKGRTFFGALLASDNAPGNFSEEERNDPEVRPSIEKFLDKNSYIGVFRVRRDVGQENSLGFLATTSNFIERHNHLGGFDGKFRFGPQTTLNFQVLGTTSRQFFFDANQGQDMYRTGNGLGYFLTLSKNGRHLSMEYRAQGRSRDYRANVGFTRRTNSNQQLVNLNYISEQHPKSRLINYRIGAGSNIGFDFQGRTQYGAAYLEAEYFFQRQINIGFGYERGYERVFEEEFGPRRSFTNPGTFAGTDPERSAHRNTGYIFGNMTPSRKFRINGSIGYDAGVLDFDFGGGPRFPRVSPAALLDPNAPLDPGAAHGLNMDAETEIQPTSALNLTIRYNYNRLKREDTGRTAFRSHILSFRVKYQLTRFLFIRARADYNTLAANLNEQFLFGWTPNPGTAFYVGYNDNLNRNGFNPFDGGYEPGLQRNRRSFFVKFSYLFRWSLGKK